jgi:hypothetical protein
MIVFSIVNTEEEKLFPSSSNLSAMKYKNVVEKTLKKIAAEKFQNNCRKFL